jgi:multidrug efflux pump subunit AcrA (membrane-fusion protein)
MSSKRVRRWLLTAGVVGLGAVGFVAFGRSGTPTATVPEARAEKPAVAVVLEPVTARPVRRTVTVVGSLYGRDEVTVTPKVEGRVLKIHHDVGDVVRPGETLLELDPVDCRLAVAEARRGLELELAKLGLKELPVGPFDVQALPSVVRAAALVKNAAARRERLAQLGNVVATAEERDQLNTDYEVARANHSSAILDAEATLAAARQRQAMLETAEQKLRDTRVVVPRPSDKLAPDGKPLEYAEYVVSSRSVTEGEIVQTMPIPGLNSTLFKLVIDRPLKLQAAVPERHRGEVRVGMSAELTVEAYPSQTFAGTVARVSPMVDRASRTFQVEIHVPNADRRLSAGSFAKAAILTRIDEKARTVPEEALVSFAGVTKVFVVKDGVAHEVPVKAGVSIDVPSEPRVSAAEPRASARGGARTWVEIEGELPLGTLIVTAGQTQLADGTAVRVREGAGK